MRKGLDESIVEHKSKPPLRWFANMCGSIAGWAIMRISYHDELENFGWRYKLHSFIWKITWPVYYKFGTFYVFDFDMSGDGWNDYDSEGVPYWEKTGFVDPDYERPWDYIDDNGDAFRVVRRG
jgi:hypothetical protein